MDHLRQQQRPPTERPSFSHAQTTQPMNPPRRSPPRRADSAPRRSWIPRRTPNQQQYKTATPRPPATPLDKKNSFSSSTSQVLPATTGRFATALASTLPAAAAHALWDSAARGPRRRRSQGATAQSVRQWLDVLTRLRKLHYTTSHYPYYCTTILQYRKHTEPSEEPGCDGADRPTLARRPDEAAYTALYCITPPILLYYYIAV